MLGVAAGRSEKRERLPNISRASAAWKGQAASPPREPADTRGQQ
jgi:hypothetical protein